MVPGGVMGLRWGGDVILYRSVAAFPLVQLHLKLFNLSLFLVQLPRQLLNHFLLFNQHFVFLSLQTIHTSTLSSPRSSAALAASPQAFLGAELGRGRLQGKLRGGGHGHVAEAVGERTAEGKI